VASQRSRASRPLMCLLSVNSALVDRQASLQHLSDTRGQVVWQGLGERSLAL
jgi:hypothetical protein